MSDYCKFCLQPFRLEIDTTGKAKKFWLECYNCNVTYTYNKINGLHIHWEWDPDKPPNEDIIYALNIYWYPKETILWYYNRKALKTNEIVLPTAIKNVTPKTLASKIKTILTYS